jgi:peptidoglycan/xylan/chitin deacetylase (PgdA/CDA1 family)
MGWGFNTIKASVRHKVVRSFILIAVALIALVSYTSTELDDWMFWLCCALLAGAVYLQSDWLITWAEKADRRVIWRIPTKQPVAALTIDDVPLLEKKTALPEILDILRKHEVKATLMIMSGFDTDEGGMKPEERQRCKDLLRQALVDGHELANHMQYDRPAISLSNDQFDEAFLHCDRFLAEMYGEDVWQSRQYKWFRPASALWSGHILDMAGKYKYKTVITNCHPFDAADSSRHLNSHYLRKNVSRGSVIVVHDRWHTPKTLDQALPLIKKTGLNLVTVSELQRIADSEKVPLDKESHDKAS